MINLVGAAANNNNNNWNKKALITSKAPAKPPPLPINGKPSTTNKNSILVKSNKTTSKLDNSLVSSLTSSTLNPLSNHNKSVDFSTLFRRFIKSIIDWANEDA